MNHTPRYEHDCDACTFIGQLVNHDIYTCPQGVMPTVIARWGDEGPEYTSGQDLSYLYAVEITLTIEPRHLRHTFFQIAATAFAVCEEAHGCGFDTDDFRWRLAADVLGRVLDLYRLGYVDEKPTLVEARKHLDRMLVTHAS